MLHLQQVSQLPQLLPTTWYALALRATKTHVLPKTFKDVTKLLADSKKRWLEFCLEELKLLKDRDVYEIVDLPKGRKVVKNC